MSLLPFITNRQTGIVKDGSKFNYDFLLKRFVCGAEEEFRTLSPVNVLPVPPFACQFRKDRSSGDADVLAIASEEGEIILLDTDSYPTPVKVQSWSAHYNAIFDVCWVPDCPKIISAGGDHNAILWDAATRTRIVTFCSHTGSVKSIDVCPTQTSVFATGSRDGTIKIWDMRIPRCSHCDGIRKPEISIACDLESPISSKTSTRGKKKVPSASKLKSITAVAFQDINHLASTDSTSPIVKIWDLRRTYTTIKINTPKPKYTLAYKGTENSSHGSTSMAFDSSRKRLYVCCTDHRVYALDCHSYSSDPLHTYHGSKVQTFFVKLALSCDDKFLLSGSSDEKAYIWKTSQPGVPIINLKGHSAEVTSVAWNPHKLTNLATCGDDNKVMIWNVCSDEYLKNRENIVGSASPVRNIVRISENISKEADTTFSTPGRTILKERALTKFFPVQSTKNINVLSELSPKKSKINNEVQCLTPKRNILQEITAPCNNNNKIDCVSPAKSGTFDLLAGTISNNHSKENAISVNNVNHQWISKKKQSTKHSPPTKIIVKSKSRSPNLSSPAYKKRKHVQGNLITSYFQEPTNETK